MRSFPRSAPVDGRGLQGARHASGTHRGGERIELVHFGLTEVQQHQERESKAISQFSHPHICTLDELGRAVATERLGLEHEHRLNAPDHGSPWERSGSRNFPHQL